MSFQKRGKGVGPVGEITSSNSRSLLVGFPEGDTKVMKVEDFLEMLNSGPQGLGNGENQHPFYKCYLLDDSAGGRGIEIPTNIVKAMEGVGSGIRGGTVPDEATENGDMCSWCAGSFGETSWKAIKGVFKTIGKIHKVSDLLAGAFGPSHTRQKVERCLTELGCLLLVLSLSFALALAANAKFTAKPDPVSSLAWKAVIWHASAHCMLFGYGVFMVKSANKMAASESFTEQKGRNIILWALAPFLFFVGVLAFV